MTQRSRKDAGLGAREMLYSRAAVFGSMCALRCATIKCGATGFALPFGGLYGNTRESPLRVPRTPGEDALSKSKELRLCQSQKTCPLRYMQH